MKKSVIALALLGFGSLSTGALAQEVVVKIGHSAPLTGGQAHLGKDTENGARLALEEINAKGTTIGGKKIKFELMGEDDQADPKTGTTVAQRLVDSGVKGVVGHMNSGTAIPASRIYNQAGMVQVSPSATNPTLTNQGYAGTFRVMANDVAQGGSLGKFAVAKLGKKVAIIDDRTAYGQGLADEVDKAVKAAGGSVTGREFTTDKAADFAAILTKIKAQNPDVIFFGGMDTQAGPMIKQMKQLGMTAKFLGGDGACTTEMAKLAGDAISANAYCSNPGVPLDTMPGGKTFKERYTKRFNLEIQAYAPYAYDAATAIVTAMKAANSVEPAKYLPALKKVSFDGVTGKVMFDAKGDIKDGVVTMYQFSGGKWSELK